jgi:EmrB/QacA subfamily drug resistance transporter
MTTTVQASSRSRWLAFGVLCAVQLMVIIDTSIVNIALPSIQARLGFTQANLGWISNAYTIAFGGLLLLSGRLGDLIGRKYMFMAGLAVFTASSLLCGVAVNRPMMIVGRFLEGAGAAMAAAVVMGIVITIFESQEDRAKAIAGFSFVAAAGGSIGVLAGGVLTEAISWRWVFFINLPIGVAAVLLAIPLVATDRGLGLRAGADMPGAVAVTAGLMLAVYTIVLTGSYGWSSVHTLGLGALAILLLAAFALRQVTAAQPLVPPRLFASRNLSGANVIQLLFVAGMFGFNFLGTLYLQRVVGYSPLRASFAFLPIAVALAALSLGMSAKLTVRYGPRNVLLAGLVLVITALGLAARAPVHAMYVIDVLPMAVLLGAGAGLAMPAIMSLAMSVATPQDAGVASGVASTAGMAGGALGLAVLTTLSSGRMQHLLGIGESARAAMNGGFHLAFAVSAVFVAVGLLIGLFVLRSTPMPIGPPPPRQPAAEDEAIQVPR